MDTQKAVLLVDEINGCLPDNRALRFAEEVKGHDRYYKIYMIFSIGETATKYVVHISTSLSEIIACLEFTRNVTPALVAK